MGQEEVPKYVSDELPELEISAQQSGQTATIYQIMNLLVNYTHKQLTEQHYDTVKKCFGLVEGLYTNGNSRVRCAVENVYVYALDKLLLSCNCDREKVHGLLPVHLYKLYVGQMVSSNI